jgi:predicted ATPase/DNA-binding winged helix-turn-helix (wHTH) protein
VSWHDAGAHEVSTSTAPAEQAISFGPFRLLPAQRLLLEDGMPVRLGSRALEILTALVEHAGELVSKTDLIGRVWPDTFVDESSLRVHIAGLRRALGDGQPGRRYLANIPGRGYRFVAPISRSEPEFLPADSKGIPARAHNLPVSQSRVVGRIDVIATIQDQLPRWRFVSIVGEGGIGKTTVALALAEALLPVYEDGVWLVDLAPVDDQRLVPIAAGSALGLTVHAEDALSRLSDFVRDKRMLVVLDSCEHVVEVAAVLAEQLLAGAPGVHVLVTSREPLRAEGERVHRLPPLDSPAIAPDLTAAEALAFPAIRLFVERAAAILDGFELSDADAPIVADICRKLGGIALAIEFAAARVDAFGVRQLSVLLDDRFHILRRGRRTAQPRHQSLTAALDWSYEFLPEGERVILRRLSVFAGAFTLESAIAVAGDDGMEVLDAVANLVAKSLISADVSEPTVQYRLLETTRAYAMQKLIEAGEFEACARRHAQHHFDWFKRAEAAWTTRPTGAQWLKDHGRGVDDVRSALNWAFSPDGDAMFGVALTVASIPLWLELSLVHECRAHAERALASQALQPSPNERDTLKLRLARGLVLPHASRFLPRDEGSFGETLALAERLDDREAQLRALNQWSVYCVYVGNYRGSLALAERHRTLADSSGFPQLSFIGSMMVGNALQYLGDCAGALRHLDPIVKQPAPLQRSLFVERWVALHLYANALWQSGYPDQAVRYAQQAVVEARTTRNALTHANILAQGSCSIALYVGDLAEVERSVGLLLDYSAKPALNTWNALGRCFQGRLLLARGDLAGLPILRSALDWLREAGFTMRYAISLGALAEGLTAAGQLAEAHTAIGEALELAESNEEHWCLPELLRIKGEIIRSDGSATADGAAEDCFQQALDWARRQGALSWELRAVTSMARLWYQQGKTAEAHALLSGVYDRFTEGFGTADLRAARTLLDELR